MAISWDEALDTVAKRLNAVRAAGLTDEVGYPRVAASFGGGGTPQSYMGTLPAFLGAWGPVDMGFGSGQGVKCYHSEHLYGEFWHRAFTVSPDTPLCDYLISCGANVEASGGVVGVWRHANARVRGMKRVQVEPHLSVTGACSAEWVPIRPKTDAALLYALEKPALEPGDFFLLFTDGLSEAMNPGAELFGEGRLRRILEEGRALGSEELKERILEEVRHFVGEADPHDDMTLVVLKVVPEEKAA